MAKGRQQYFADEVSIQKEAREFAIEEQLKAKIDSVEEGAQVNVIETVKVNGDPLIPDAEKAVDVSVPLVEDTLYSVDTEAALSARQGKVLYDYILNLQSRGRYLSNWNCATGLPTTNPYDSPYEYRAGDYFLVSNVSTGTNYRPDGSEYVIGVASTTVETEIVGVSDMYIYDGTTWQLIINSERPIAIDDALSPTSTNPVENRVVTQAIGTKQNIITDLQTIREGAAKGDTAVQPGDSLSTLSGDSDDIAEGSSHLFMTTSERTKLGNQSGVNTGDETQATIMAKLGVASASTNGYLTSTDWNTFNNKQDAIQDLQTIRENATAGKNASDTIATYGDIVTHDASEFASSSDMTQVQGDITSLQGDMTQAQSDIIQNANDITGLDTRLDNAEDDIDNLQSDMTTAQGDITQIQTDLAGKQDTLVAGTNIQIDPNTNTISATDTTYTAGPGISISQNNVISNTRTSAEWGNITGTLSDQTDLQNALDEKQNSFNVVDTLPDVSQADMNATYYLSVGDNKYEEWIVVEKEPMTFVADPNNQEHYIPLEVTFTEPKTLTFYNKTGNGRIEFYGPASNPYIIYGDAGEVGTGGAEGWYYYDGDDFVYADASSYTIPAGTYMMMSNSSFSTCYDTVSFIEGLGPTPKGWVKVGDVTPEWGTITGNLSDQIDLQNALNLKADATDINTKTFYIPGFGSSAAIQAAAQEAYNWYKAGKNPLIVIDGVVYTTTGIGDNTRLWFTNRYKPLNDTSSTKWYTYGAGFEISSGRVLKVFNTGVGEVSQSSFLRTDYNYPTPYTPAYDGSPATKKYVDDAVAGITPGQTYTAGNGINIDQNNEISADTSVVATQIDLSNGLADKQDKLIAGNNITIRETCEWDTQGPAPDGFHIPSKDEWEALLPILFTTFSLPSREGTLRDYLKMTLAGYRSMLGNATGQSYGYYWTSTASNTYTAFCLTGYSGMVNISDIARSNATSIRCFKNVPVVPDNSWTTLYDGSSVAAGAGIFHNTADGLISVSGDGQTWYTIQDKNLGATEVFNGGTVTDANSGYFYQWGNNYGFAHSGDVTTSSTQVDASNYGPGNYYSSSTFITRSYEDANWDWSSTLNNNLRGGVTQGQGCKAIISAIGATYTAGTGINIDANNEISNTLPGPTIAATAPTGIEGALWYDTTNDVLKSYDGTSWKEAGTQMKVLSYGHSTWQDFLDAYNENAIVYCRASSGSNPGSGKQGRMAFMAFIDINSSTGVLNSVEFQYYRSRSDHNTSANQLDEVYVYKLTNSGTWSVTQRNTAAKAVAGTGISLTFGSGNMTIANTGVTSFNGNTGAITLTPGTYLSLNNNVIDVDTSLIATKADLANFAGFLVVAQLPTTDIKTNIIYLLGPVGTGADKYEEYIYSNNNWIMIGDTSIDLSPYFHKTNDNSDDIIEGSTNLFLTTSERTKLGNTSGTNSGDETKTSIQTKLGAASSSNSGYLTSTDWDTFNGKQNALSAQTAYTSKGSATKVPQITTNSLGQVTGITEVDIQSGGTYNAGYGISIGDVTKNGRQGPAPDGFHVPSSMDWGSLKSAMDTLQLTTGDNWKEKLFIPFAGGREYSGASTINQGSNGYYWSSSPYDSGSPSYASLLYLDSSTVNAGVRNYRSYSYSVRCFKDNPVIPTSSWTTLYQGMLADSGVYWNSIDGLISISGNGFDWITIQDKNLGATTVYNSGDTLSEANCGKYYQRGNNYGFQFTGNVTTSSTQVDASGYGPNTSNGYYGSSIFITGNEDWSSVHNDDLWGEHTGIYTQENTITNTGVLSVNGQTGNVSITAGDMSYSDFGWQAKTGASFTLDLASTYTPSANFTVNAPSTIKDGQVYVLRVYNGATAYTMTLGSNISNPFNVDLTLTASGIDQFVFLAVNGTLELQPEGGGGGGGGAITADTTGTTTSISKIWVGTEAEYQALTTYEEDVAYMTF